jgi:hypothetical protein
MQVGKMSTVIHELKNLKILGSEPNRLFSLLVKLHKIPKNYTFDPVFQYALIVINHMLKIATVETLALLILSYEPELNKVTREYD